MNRYVLYKKGEEATREELAEIAGDPGVTIIENDIRQLFLIEANDETLDRIREALPGWTIGIETIHPHPGRPMESVRPTGGNTRTED